MSLAEDLRRLETLDPETWVAIDFAIDIEDGTYLENNYDQDIIQGCIQRAIAAKGHAIETYQYESESFARILIISDDLEFGRKVIGEGRGRSPAEALLSAYRQALEAQ